MSDDTKPRSSQYTCNEHREEMILLGLQRQLTRTDLTDEERAALLEEITKLEKEMGL